MGCIFHYKNHTFNSEIELDDFILSHNFENYKKYGDMVFSKEMSQMQKDIHDIIESKIKTDAEDAVKIRNEYYASIRRGSIFVDEDGESYFDFPPYTAVTKFLAGTRNSRTNELYTPEFRIESYWLGDGNKYKGQYDKWANGEFTPDEIMVLFNNAKPEGAKIIISEDDIAKERKNKFILDESKKYKNEYRLKMEDYWLSLAYSGSGIHKAMEIFFTDENYLKTPEELLAIIKAGLKEEEPEYLTFMTDDIIKLSIEIGRRVHNAIMHSCKTRGASSVRYYPEMAVTSKIDKKFPGKGNKLFGIVDLYAVDSLGNTMIIDYKTTTKKWGDFLSPTNPKHRAFAYQLGLYGRMLGKYGININKTSYNIVPITLSELTYSGKNNLIFNKITPSNRVLEDISSEIKFGNINNNLDDILAVYNVPIPKNGLDLLKFLKESMSKWFFSYTDKQQLTLEELKEEIELSGKGFVKTENGYKYTLPGTKKEIVAATDTELLQNVFKEYQKYGTLRAKTVNQIKSALRESLRSYKGKVDMAQLPKLKDAGYDSSWLANMLNKYGTCKWEVKDNDYLESINAIELYNKVTRSTAIIKLESGNIYSCLYNRTHAIAADGRSLKNRMNLAGAFVADSEESSNADSLMLEATYGNIAAIETLLALNFSENCEGDHIDSIVVMNPFIGQEISPSNEELLYNFNRLNDLCPIVKNSINDLHFATKFELVIEKFDEILNMSDHQELPDSANRYSDIISSHSYLYESIDGTVDQKLAALNKLKKLLEDLNPKLKGLNLDLKELNDLFNDLYNRILIAMANLHGINFRQLLADHANWLESVLLYKNGLSANYLDNPGNLSSATLNLITKLVEQSHLNTRDVVFDERNKIKKLIDDLKEELSFTNLKSRTYGNMIDLFRDTIIDTSRNDELMVKRLNEIQGVAARKFAEYFLEKINNDRYGEIQAKRYKEENSDYYYQIPLTFGHFDTLSSSRGMMKAFREKIKNLLPSVAWDNARKELEGLAQAENKKVNKDLEDLFVMTSMFEKQTNLEWRANLFLLHSPDYFNLDLETLLLLHIFAHVSENNMKEIMPTIKAAAVHLVLLGAMSNTLFANDLKYLEEYIKNKIKRQPIVSELYLAAAKVTQLFLKAASILTLAFSPVQFSYQLLQGFWDDIKVAIVELPNSLGKKVFTFDHFKKAAKLVYADMLENSETLTLPSALNMLYGLNDMDANTYALNVSSNRHGLFNILRLAFKFSSRPDYYNRLTLFCTQMEADGCLDAHSIVDGELKYDWTKDKRFSKFSQNPTADSKDPEFLAQKALYYQMGKLFEKEHTKYKDKDGRWVEWKLDMKNPKPLPRAYTTLEAESIKSYADDIYGYYTNERKALVLATFLGSLWLQMKTYWSAKKNLYLAKGGNKLQGYWEQAKDKDGKPLYYALDEHGNITEQITTDPASGLQVTLWKGQWQEGIILSLHHLIDLIAEKKSFKEGWDYYMSLSPDNPLRKAYIENFRRATYDLFAWGLGGGIIGQVWLGSWLDLMIGENKKNKDLTAGLALTGMLLAIKTVQNSFMDFNMVESIGSPLWDWQPFTFGLFGNRAKNWWNVVMGDLDFFDGVVNTFSTSRLMKPLFDAVKPDMFRNKQEGGTWRSGW